MYTFKFPLRFIFILTFFTAGLGTEFLRSFDIVNDSYITKHVNINISIYILAISQFSLFSIFVFFFIKDPYIHFKNKTYNYSTFNLFLFFIALLLVIIFQSDYLFNPQVSRHSGSHNINRVVFFITLLGFCYNLFILRRTINLTTLAFLFLFLVYPLATSSRMAALPFLLLFFYYFVNSKYIMSFISFIIILQVLAVVFLTRDNPGLIESIKFLFSYDVLINSIITIPILMSLMFPGLETTSVVLNKSFEFDELSNSLIYLSIIPSWLMNDDLFYKSSLSPLLGIDINSLGVNSDIFSEGYYRNGYIGYFLFPLFIPFLFQFCSLIIIKFFRNQQVLYNLFFILLFFITLYSFFGSFLFSMRAATRGFYIAILIFFIFKFLRVLYANYRQYYI